MPRYERPLTAALLPPPPETHRGGQRGGSPGAARGATDGKRNAAAAEPRRGGSSAAGIAFADPRRSVAPHTEALAAERGGWRRALFPSVPHRATNGLRCRHGSGAAQTLRSQQLHVCASINELRKHRRSLSRSFYPWRRICRKRSCRSPQSKGRQLFVPSLRALVLLGRDSVLQDVVLRIRPEPALCFV